MIVVSVFFHVRITYIIQTYRTSLDLSCIIYFIYLPLLYVTFYQSRRKPNITLLAIGLNRMIKPSSPILINNLNQLLWDHVPFHISLKCKNTGCRWRYDCLCMHQMFRICINLKQNNIWYLVYLISHNKILISTIYATSHLGVLPHPWQNI